MLALTEVDPGDLAVYLAFERDRVVCGYGSQGIQVDGDRALLHQVIRHGNGPVCHGAGTAGLLLVGSLVGADAVDHEANRCRNEQNDDDNAQP